MNGPTITEGSYLSAVETIRQNGVERFGERGYERIIFTNGCFDVLHVGHLYLLDECRKLAGPKGTVVVGVNSDESVKRLKGESRPVNKEFDRCMMLIHLKPVDHVVIFDEDTPIELVRALRPELIVKGSDYVGTNVIGSDISPVHFVDLVEGASSTSVIERIKNG